MKEQINLFAARTGFQADIIPLITLHEAGDPRPLIHFFYSFLENPFEDFTIHALAENILTNLLGVSPHPAS